MKQILAFFLDVIGINRITLYCLNKKYRNNYIRVINYHETKKKDFLNFEKQLKWYKKHYENVNMQQFQEFMQGKREYNKKPGIMLTFDDGIDNNYISAKGLLNKYSFTGYYFVSPDLVGTDGYMTWKEIVDLNTDGHVIGSHTSTHHRMMEMDDNECLHKEIVESKRDIEQALGNNVDIFCWCGGEEQHYTKQAAEAVRAAGYMFGFMTNSFPVTHYTDPYQIERSNVDATWKMSLVRFQVCGWMDLKLRKKRERVEKLTR